MQTHALVDRGDGVFLSRRQERPIGNFTSQWMGNLYMNELDQYMSIRSRSKTISATAMTFFFHNDKAALRGLIRRVEDFVGAVLKLRLSKCDLFPASRGVDFLACRHFKGYILL